MAAAGGAGGGGEQGQIDISNVPTNQLEMMKKQMEQEDKVLTNNYQQLKAAEGRFEESKLALEAFTPDSLGKTILVPLTSSLYVPGKVADAERVMVDVGTGYYVSKPVPAAVEFFEKKVKLLKTNTEGLQRTINERRGNLHQVITVLNERVRQEAAAAAGGD
mmetsp:Transcript_20417/g.72222  ORF Transcript_20417/g.72222 Transcript_20417/m.72222 type:complete len:162 (-) Transcript_20417:73-558(-)